MRVRDLVEAMERIAPQAYAEPWDRVGLQVGVLDRALEGPVLLTIDLTEGVLAEAVSARAGAIIAYHPPIFEPLTRVTDHSPRQRIVLGATEARIAIYSPHTALDAAPGGVTDWLCEAISAGEPGRIAGDCRAITPFEQGADNPSVKIVTFIPAESVERVREALASAGAGLIGNYSVCSFAAPGEGTFLAGADAAPTHGQAGRFERVAEQRLEMVCPRRALAIALETLRGFHPYEEPAIDIYPLAPAPQRRVGAGRRLVLDRPATVTELAQRLKTALGTPRVRMAIPGPDRPIRTLGVVPGAGESLAPAAGSQGCEAFITGEMRHHQVLAALHAGMGVIVAGHTNTERGFLPRLAERLAHELPSIICITSREDQDPLISV